jgi:hypothetical protein
MWSQTHSHSRRTSVLVVLRHAPSVTLCWEWLTRPHDTKGIESWQCLASRGSARLSGSAPNKFRRNILAVGRDGKPSPSKANVRTVLLGRALPPKAEKHVDLAEPSGMGGLDENLSSQAHFLGAKACSRSGPSKAHRAICQWARGCTRGHSMSIAPSP